MNYVIDTQVLVWLLDGDKRLGKETRKLLTETPEIIYVSYFSFFELTIKSQKGRYKLDLSVIDDLPAMGLTLLMPDTSVLHQYRIVSSANTDPFDNVLLATAAAQYAAFVTADMAILASDTSIKLHDARK